MPRSVRNFWIEVEVDGRKSQVATGPVGKDGGFYLRVLMREDGDISDKYVVARGYVTRDGKVTLEGHVYPEREEVFRLQTDR